jgi:hypothetical protein
MKPRLATSAVIIAQCDGSLYALAGAALKLERAVHEPLQHVGLQAVDGDPEQPRRLFIA